MSFASLTAGNSAASTWTQVRYAATGTLVSLALLLLARQLAGALVAPLSPVMSLACGFVLGALVLIGEWHPTLGPGRGTHLPRIPAALAAALLPTASTTALLAKFAWVPAIAIASRLRLGGEGLAPQRPAVEKPSRVRQQLTRTLEADGRDVCRGSARAEFAVGRRSASIHLAFCPPFATLPQLEAATEQMDATAKVAQVLPYAARIEVKLSAAAADRRDVIVSFTASAPSS